MKKLLLTIAIQLLIINHLQSQSIAVSVARDSKTQSHIAYQFAYSCEGVASSVAYDRLKKQGHKNIMSIFSRRMTTGVYSLIKAKTKNLDGSERISYGFGVDTSSKEVSLKEAKNNLEANNWSWREKDGYEVVQQSSFSACEGKALMATYKVQPKGKGDTIVGFTAKERVVNYKAKQIDPDTKLFRIPPGHSNVIVLELVYLNDANARHSEVKVLTAASQEELEKLIVQESVGNLDKNLQDIYIRYKSTNGKNVADSRSIMEKFRDQLQSLFIKTQAEICEKDVKRCEQLKKRKACMCIRG